VNYTCDFKLFDIPLINKDIQEVSDYILSSLYSGNCVSLATPNIDHFVRIAKYPEIKEVYRRIDFCVNDSRILGQLLKLFFGIKLTTVTGSDLTALLFNSDVIHRRKIAIIGSHKEDISKLAALYNIDLALLSHFSPPMDFIKDESAVNKTVDFVAESGADLVFVAVGSPQQEIVAAKIQQRVNTGVILCVGASIDYLTGKEIRAPKFIQMLYLEWLFRFAQSPIKRFRRYFINCPQIFYYLLRERFLTKKL
tara:strand:- start:4552 stop:5307 length:756 start_codon:yes stop_codon:yes gene_type:complete